jgi:hypothetical protein
LLAFFGEERMMSTPGGNERFPRDVRAMIQAIERFARQTGWPNGKCSAYLSYGQVAKLKFTVVVSFAIAAANREVAPDPARGGQAANTLLPKERFRSILASYLTNCKVRFGAIRFHLKNYKVHRVILVISHAKQDWDDLDGRLFRGE